MINTNAFFSMLLMFRYRGDAIEERRVSRGVQTDPVELLVRYFSCKCASQLIGFLEHTLTASPSHRLNFPELGPRVKTFWSHSRSTEGKFRHHHEDPTLTTAAAAPDFVPFVSFGVFRCLLLLEPSS